MAFSLFHWSKPETDSPIPLTGESFQQESAGREMAYALRRLPEIPLVELGQMSGFTLPPARRFDLPFDTLNLQNTQDGRMRALQDSMLAALSQSVLGFHDRLPGIFLANGSAANAAAVKVAYEMRGDRIEGAESLTVLSSMLSHRSINSISKRIRKLASPSCVNRRNFTAQAEFQVKLIDLGLTG